MCAAFRQTGYGGPKCSELKVETETDRKGGREGEADKADTEEGDVQETIKNCMLCMRKTAASTLRTYIMSYMYISMYIIYV